MPALAGKEDWEVTQALANALGLDWDYAHPSQIMAEIARLTPTFHGVTYEKLDRLVLPDEERKQWMALPLKVRRKVIRRAERGDDDLGLPTEEQQISATA